MSERSLSSLETLLAEILGKVFLLSNNVNLALSSHVIGAKLSSELMFRVMTVRILFRGDDAENYTDYGTHNTSTSQLVSWDMKCLLRDVFSVFSSQDQNWPPLDLRLRREAVRLMYQINKYDLWNESSMESAQHKVLAAKFMTWARFKKYMTIASGSTENMKEIFQRSIQQPFALALNDSAATSTYHALKLLRYRSLIPFKFLQAPFTTDGAECLRYMLKLGMWVQNIYLKDISTQEKTAIIQAAEEEETGVLMECLKHRSIALVSWDHPWVPPELREIPKTNEKKIMENERSGKFRAKWQLVKSWFRHQ
jgi:hypothetical protein